MDGEIAEELLQWNPDELVIGTNSDRWSSPNERIANSTINYGATDNGATNNDATNNDATNNDTTDNDATDNRAGKLENTVKQTRFFGGLLPTIKETLSGVTGYLSPKRDGEAKDEEELLLPNDNYSSSDVNAAAHASLDYSQPPTRHLSDMSQVSRSHICARASSIDSEASFSVVSPTTDPERHTISTLGSITNQSHVTDNNDDHGFNDPLNSLGSINHFSHERMALCHSVLRVDNSIISNELETIPNDSEIDVLCPTDVQERVRFVLDKGRSQLDVIEDTNDTAQSDNDNNVDDDDENEDNISYEDESDNSKLDDNNDDGISEDESDNSDELEAFLPDNGTKME